MTAITPDFDGPVAPARPRVARGVLLAAAALISAAQAAVSGVVLVLPGGSGWTWWGLLALHAAMVAGPIALAGWSYASLARERRGTARPIAHLLRACMYVGVLTALTTVSFEASHLGSEAAARLLWLLRSALALGVPVVTFVYLKRSATIANRYGRSFAGQVADVEMESVARDGAFAVLLMLGVLLFVLTRAAIPSMRTFGWSFLVTSEWRPNPLPGGPKLDANGDAMTDPATGETLMNPESPPQFGALPVIWGTAVSSLIALVVAVPLSFGAALFLVRVAPELRPVVFLYFLLGAAITGVLLLLMAHSVAGTVAVFLVGAGIAAGLAWAVGRFIQQDVTPRRTIRLAEIGAAIGIVACTLVLVHALVGLSGPWTLFTAVLVGGILMAAAPQVTAAVSFLIEFLAAIPSIAYGIWGIFALAPFLQRGIEPGFVAAYEALPIVSWGHLFIIVLPPLLAFLAAWLFYRFAPASVGQRAVYAVWAVVLVIGLAGMLYGFHLAYAGVPVMPAADAWLQTHLHFRPTLWWMFNDALQVEGQPTTYRQVPLTGNDMLAGGLILAIMIIPIITAISRDVLKAVPRAQIEGTTALGATWWGSSKEMLKFSRSALFGAVMLGLARAAGETMAVTMVIGTNPQIKFSPFMAAQTMSSLLANQFAEAGENQRAALFEVALILLLMSLAFNVVARYLVVGKGSRSAAAH
jgi:ABC-type phosphate transport system permease subunit